jgi:PAS domain S-box-containing protein
MSSHESQMIPGPGDLAISDVLDALKASEEHYRLVAENTNDVIWTMGLDASITYVSPSVERVRGLSPAEAMAQPVQDIHPPESLAIMAGYFARLQEAVANRIPVESFRGDLEYRRKDGSSFWGDVFAYPEFNADGSFRQIVGVTRDITERKAQELALRKAHEELARQRDQLEARVLERTRELAAARDHAEQASQAKSMLLSNMSHELRTPLHHIIGFNGLLRSEVSNPRSLQRLDRVEQSAYQLLKLVENLLDTASIESNQFRLEPADFDIDELIERVDSDTGAVAAARTMAVDWQVGTLSQRRLHGDCRCIAQVLSELVVNALKFSTQGPVVIRLRQCGEANGCVTLRFEVEDRGAGIPPELQPRIFELFFQGDGGLTRSFGGTGLGLALCSRLVRLMAGDIGFASTLGEGSLFWLQIPLEVAAPLAASAAATGGANQPAAPVRALLAALRCGDPHAQALYESDPGAAQALLDHSLFFFEVALETGNLAQAAEILAESIGAAASIQ